MVIQVFLVYLDLQVILLVAFLDAEEILAAKD